MTSTALLRREREQTALAPFRGPRPSMLDNVEFVERRAMQADDAEAQRDAMAVVVARMDAGSRKAIADLQRAAESHRHGRLSKWELIGTLHFVCAELAEAHRQREGDPTVKEQR